MDASYKLLCKVWRTFAVITVITTGADVAVASTCPHEVTRSQRHQNKAQRHLLTRTATSLVFTTLESPQGRKKPDYIFTRKSLFSTLLRL